MQTPIILFILKRREDFNPEKHNEKGLSTGLFNSASFMVDMLNAANIDARLEVVIDNNDIDRVVTKHRPTHVIIEALWVVPSKFSILSKLHPKVKWVIRLHSEMPFLAGEGMAMDWLGDYILNPKVYIGVNAPRMRSEVKTYLKIKQQWSQEETDNRIIYLPNYYPQEYKTKSYEINKEYIDIGCFGAVRPFKNHMIQAIAAIKFADHIGKKLRFHINVGRIEMKGEPVMSNLRSLFLQLYDQGHQLIANTWAPRDEFLMLCGKMDIGLQVSFSETFNIVGADIISQGVPLVGSVEIPWIDSAYSSRAESSEDIYNALLLAHSEPQRNVESNQVKLTAYTNETENTWIKYFTKEIQNG